MLVSTPLGLELALASSTGGEFIDLAPGNYGVVNIGKDYLSNVTIASSDRDNPALFEGMTLTGSNVSLEGIRFEFPPSQANSDVIAWKSGASQKPFVISGASAVRVSDSVFDGPPVVLGMYGTGIGLNVVNCDDVIVESNEFSFWYKALVFSHSSRCLCLSNDIHHSNNDGLNIIAVSDMLVEGNWIHDGFTVPGEGHNDMIQGFNKLGFPRMQNVTISGNFLDAGTGTNTQMLFIGNGVVGDGTGSFADYAYHNILIEDNVIYGAHAHGVTVGASDGLTIQNNTIIYNPDTTSGFDHGLPEIRTPSGQPFENESLNVVIAGNNSLGGFSETFSRLDVEATLNTGPQPMVETSTLVYSITGGADAALFEIATDGSLGFVTAPDYENPLGSGATPNDYLVQVTVTDSGGLVDVQDLTVSITDVVENAAPVITSVASVSIPENQTFVIDVNATDDLDVEGS